MTKFSHLLFLTSLTILLGLKASMTEFQSVLLATKHLVDTDINADKQHIYERLLGMPMSPFDAEIGQMWRQSLTQGLITINPSWTIEDLNALDRAEQRQVCSRFFSRFQNYEDIAGMILVTRSQYRPLLRSFDVASGRIHMEEKVIRCLSDDIHQQTILLEQRLRDLQGGKTHLIYESTLSKTLMNNIPEVFRHIVKDTPQYKVTEQDYKNTHKLYSPHDLQRIYAHKCRIQSPCEIPFIKQRLALLQNLSREYVSFPVSAKNILIQLTDREKQKLLRQTILNTPIQKSPKLNQRISDWHRCHSASQHNAW